MISYETRPHYDFVSFNHAPDALRYRRKLENRVHALADQLDDPHVHEECVELTGAQMQIDQGIALLSVFPKFMIRVNTENGYSY